MDKKDLVIGIPREIFEKCRCVAVAPPAAKTFVERGHMVIMESGAGANAHYGDTLYADAGVKLVADAGSVYGAADVILKIRPPLHNPALNRHELDLIKPGGTILSFLAPLQDPSIVPRLVNNKLTGFAMELVPRIARAQRMDALSTMGSITGYRAALLAAGLLGKFLPGLTMAAGTVSPANVLVVGAGLVGLQAITTLHRLGAKVEAYDVRPAVKDQVQSVGGIFIESKLPRDIETTYGYAKELPGEFLEIEREAISERLPKVDIVIVSALTYGRKAPRLITADMVRRMNPGSVIVDVAAEQGGNCELTQAGETVERYGVTIHGARELPSQMPQHTSLLYSRNITRAFENLYPGQDDSINLDDEINRAALVTCKGEIISQAIPRY